MSKLLFLCFGLAVLTAPRVARAEVLTAPQTCAPDRLKLRVNNVGSSATSFWIQIFDHGHVTERRFELAATSEKKFLGTDFLKPSQTFRVKHFAGRNLHATLSCDEPLEMDSLVSPLVSFNNLRAGISYRLLARNLNATGGQTLRLRWTDENGTLLDEGTLKFAVSDSTRAMIFTAPPRAFALSIEGEARMNVRLIDQAWRRGLVAHVPAPVTVPTSPSTAYFLIANNDASESFVVAIKDPRLVAEAREIVRTASPKITVASIESVPHFSENRDFAAPEAPPWSWRVREVKAFADLASIDCGGTPSLVEERLADWLTHPQICFWTYRLKAELSPAQVANGTLQP